MMYQLLQANNRISIRMEHKGKKAWIVLRKGKNGWYISTMTIDYKLVDGNYWEKAILSKNKKEAIRTAINLAKAMLSLAKK